jgi:hypothetical protein
MAASKRPARRGSGKWMVLGVAALAAFVAVETGWAGFGWAALRSAIYPNDAALLGWVPGDTAGVAIVDPHQLKLEALGAEGTTSRSALARTRDDVKQVTGIDLAFDVDKLLLSPSLVVAHGRFDRKKLSDKLAEHRYVLAEHRGETYLVRAGEDAIAVVDGSVLLYGDEAGIKAAIDAHEDGTALEKNEQVVARLAKLGWNHPLLVTVRLVDDKPSLHTILTGSTGPRAVTAGVTTLAGLDVDVIVESASPSAGAELAKVLDEKRRSAGAPLPATTGGGPSATMGGSPPSLPGLGAEVTPVVADLAKKATVAADPQTGAVKIHVHVDPAQLDTLVKHAGAAAPFADAYKSMRLFQLLSPGG